MTGPVPADGREAPLNDTEGADGGDTELGGEEKEEEGEGLDVVVGVVGGGRLRTVSLLLKVLFAFAFAFACGEVFGDVLCERPPAHLAAVVEEGRGQGFDVLLEGREFVSLLELALTGLLLKGGEVVRERLFVKLPRGGWGEIVRELERTRWKEYMEEEEEE